MKRRQFLSTVGALAAAGVRAGPSAKRVGFLSVRDMKSLPRFREAFEARLAERGYNGSNLELRYFSGEDRVDRLDAKARELVQWAPDAAFAPGDEMAAALAGATRTIPIVFCGVYDPIAHGFAASLARPGRNLTGAGYEYASLTVKRLEMARELLPRARRIALLMRSNDAQYWRDMRARISGFGSRLGLRLDEVDVAKFEKGLPGALAAIVAKPPDIVVPYGNIHVGPDSRLIADPLKMIVEFERRQRVPVFHAGAGLADRGCVIALGVDSLDGTRRGADILVRILRGARPEETPIQMTERFVLEVNLGAARAIGLAIPESILIRASHVVP